MIDAIGREETWILKQVTHSRPKEDQVDDYTTVLWNPLFEEIAKLRIQLRAAEPSQSPAAANSARSACGASDSVTPEATPPQALPKTIMLSATWGALR